MSSSGAPTETVTSTAIAPARMIGTIMADCTISEDGTDETTITQHPVEQGAAITDHAFENPPGIVINAMWSNSSIAANGDPNYCDTIYKNLLALKSNRIPFNVLTPQRIYTNMLIKTLVKHTDEKSENALSVTITCQNIIIVQTTTTNIPPNNVQKNPQVTGSVQQAGIKQTIPAPNYNSGVPSP